MRMMGENERIEVEDDKEVERRGRCPATAAACPLSVQPFEIKGEKFCKRSDNSTNWSESHHDCQLKPIASHLLGVVERKILFANDVFIFT